ncbi:MAG: DUF5722 domain-containing protein [Eubacteriales bacterium]|nr:DUF5722 domain-containing protein [Eubacteriales bacterium]
MKRKLLAWALSLAIGLSAGTVPAMGAEFTSLPETVPSEASQEICEIPSQDLFEDTYSVPEAPLPQEEPDSIPLLDEEPQEEPLAPKELPPSMETSPEVLFEDVADLPQEESPAAPAPSKAPETQEDPSPIGSITTDAVFASKAASQSTGRAVLTCMGASAGKLRISAKISRTVASKDNKYYLFQVDPISNKLTKKVSSVTKPSGKNKTVTFRLKTDGHPEYVLAKYVLAVKSKNGTKASSFKGISNAAYVKNPEKAAVYKKAYRLPATKKGLQTTTFSQLTETNSKAVFFNLPISAVLADNAERVSYTYDGKLYYFNKIGGYTNLVSQCNQRGIQVTMQLLLDWTPSTKSLAAASSPGPRSAYYAWDSTGKGSRQKMEAIFSFLSQLFGSDQCYVSNWILGNEVNTCSRWNYAGNVSQAKYVQLYSEAFRCLYNAVRGTRASSKCFICLDQYWNNTWEDYAGKSILNSFHSNLKNLQPGVNWNLAYHAYPFPLTEADFWSGRHSNNLTNNSSSPVITLNNLSVLTNYVKANFGSKTRVILSEQGFTSSQGQDIQAAAVALAYYIAACNPQVDAFLMRSYQDEAHEVAQGLAMGIKGKKAFNVFTNMDTSKSLKYTSSYLNSRVGSGWKKHVPWYSSKRLYNLYCR